MSQNRRINPKLLYHRKINYDTIRRVLGVSSVLHKAKSCPHGISTDTSASSSVKTTDDRKIPSQNVLVDKSRIENLLAMVRSEKFIGIVDPQYHACYFSATSKSNDSRDTMKSADFKNREPIKTNFSSSEIENDVSSVEL
jgi:hypothetical protein